MAALALLLHGGLASAQSAPAAAASVNAADRVGLERAADAVENPEAYAGSGWQASADAAIKAEKDKHGEALNAISDSSPDAMRKVLSDAARTMNLPSPVASSDKAFAARPKEMRTYRIYVSQSMGEGGLRAAMAVAAGRDDMVLVLRGPLKGQTVSQLQTVLGGFVKDQAVKQEPIPNIEVDPTVFTDHKVSSVPTLEKLDASGNVVASVRGVLDPAWIDREVAGGAKGDLGAHGQTYPVTEIDLLEAFQQKAREFDWETWKTKAAENFWKKTRFTELPRATVRRVREIDPTVVVPKDIVTPDGKVIARAGDTFNPLESIGFHQTLVIYDATDPAQVAFARQALVDARGAKVKLITISVDREKGADGYVDMEIAMNHPVYMLNSAVRDAFHLERVPSTVTATKNRFVVTEVPMHQGGK
ncbi:MULTISPECIES: TrbC family F-type conjugative pilus assembly protein [unclassified Rhodanobacter]|uniref:TrbC family F-type conjugative pilus assembly protein n=1 Tax=unclassified Rhodanobacter TaxID=2621553 RepID=UPI0013730E2E|nr:TrbC family F-type conjugative pilus assembly protein [Rhodanobacter sp. FW510-R10]